MFAFHSWQASNKVELWSFLLGISKAGLLGLLRVSDARGRALDAAVKRQACSARCTMLITIAHDAAIGVRGTINGDGSPRVGIGLATTSAKQEREIKAEERENKMVKRLCRHMKQDEAKEGSQQTYLWIARVLFLLVVTCLRDSLVAMQYYYVRQ